MEASAILLAGGKSSRFGSDKTRLELDGRPLLETLCERCGALFDEVIVVGARPGQFAIPGVRALWDLIPESGPLGGLHAGLNGCRHEVVFLTACDMPAFHPAMAEALAREALEHPQWDAVVPRAADGAIEPLFAVYRGRVLPAVEALLAGRRRSMKALLDGLAVRWLEEEDWPVPPAERAALFRNLNTPEDLRRLLNECED